jgi:hypothetical protein
MKKIYTTISILFLIVLLSLNSGCKGGILPTSAGDSIEEEGFGGTITFKGTWPDSVTQTYLVVFQKELKSLSDFNILNIKYISLEIPFGSTTVNYSSLDSAYLPEQGHLADGVYEYVAVAQLTSPVISINRKDWRVAGVYYANNDSSHPGILVIPPNTFVRNINIVCDFNNPPPQPPGG